eukprot:CAMPEP_0115084048 /NCGR_PEP_ID=MMETSP0227-20121206/20990_1 /TAXON_ID=89957 /ORGANISM="Polarella glacialis, Strain CCMP 1383" /LENGTH=211 /DNA_ID=CAMNT_0002472705 /DNA_START=90 /DNA_END=722 /DNA_ORIENTATION=+
MGQTCCTSLLDEHALKDAAWVDESEPVLGDGSLKDKDDQRRDKVQRRSTRAMTWAKSSISDPTTEEKVYIVTLAKPLGQELTCKVGLDIDYAEENTSLPIVDIIGGLAEKWNLENPQCPLRKGDAIIEINKVKADVAKMLEQCRIASLLVMTVAKGDAEELGTDPVSSALLAAAALENANSNALQAEEDAENDTAGRPTVMARKMSKKLTW